jgi:hypothetical protein
MHVPIIFANSLIFPLPDSQAPKIVYVGWGVALALTPVFFGLLVFKKQLSKFKINLLAIGAIGSLILTCLIPSADRIRAVGSTARSMDNLKIIASGTLNHAEKNGKCLPSGATLDADGKPLHGWQTAILPYIDQGSLQKQIDMTAPWNAERNSVPMQQEVALFTHPLVNERHRDGYALSHYAGNIHVIGAKPVRYDEIKDGLSNTLLFGQVARNLRPWGEPMNCRDPGVGFMATEGFATPRGDYVWFALADGTVRALHRDVSPEILKALATPNGGESVNAEDAER